MNTTTLYETEEARWEAVQAREAAADGQFVYAVRTTGVYCQPSSTARLPKRQNVEFFDSAEAAEAAGYRPSRRSRGDQTSAAAERAALVARACRLIEGAETPPQLDELATEIGMSPFHFHRLFKAETGLTPKAYSSAFRARNFALWYEITAKVAQVLFVGNTLGVVNRCHRIPAIGPLDQQSFPQTQLAFARAGGLDFRKKSYLRQAAVRRRVRLKCVQLGDRRRRLSTSL
jgi:methylphosphotriester-DNA--protein-cysteine methyltransferase